MSDILPGVISSASNFQSQMLNQAFAGMNNALDKRYNLKMYEKNRNDNITQWNMQNEYNHPSAQMARLQSAGLNPNLVYGNGATTQAGSIQSAPMQISKRQSAPPLDFGNVVQGGMRTYMDLQQNKAQVDNLRAQNTVLVQEAALKAAQTADTSIRAKRGTFDLGLAEELRETSLDTAKQNLKKLTQDLELNLNRDSREERRLKLDTKIGLDRNERERLMNASTLDKMNLEKMKIVDERARILSDITNIDVSTVGKQFDNAIKEWDAKMADYGLTPNSARYIELFEDFVANFMKAAISRGKGNLKRGTSPETIPGTKRVDPRFMPPSMRPKK